MLLFIPQSQLWSPGKKNGCNIQELNALSTFELTMVVPQNPDHVSRGFLKPSSSTGSLSQQNHVAQVIVEDNPNPALRVTSTKRQLGL